MAKFLIDRTQLPYDAMVADPSWLGVVEEEKKGDAADGDTETEEIQTNEVLGKRLRIQPGDGRLCGGFY